jgi:hypothetical protein
MGQDASKPSSANLFLEHKTKLRKNFHLKGFNAFLLIIDPELRWIYVGG